MPSQHLKGQEKKMRKCLNIRKLCQLFNAIYDSGNIPVDWLTSIFATILKKSNAKAYERHRLISLMRHALKAFLKIIHKRMVNAKKNQVIL
jgi:hypothetical protein